jgi:phosphoribosyl-ATP pyrophosphohydrolase
MTIGGSQQLRLFRQARRNGHGLGIAAEMAGMSLGEARLTEEADAKSPPPPEAFEPITMPQVAAQPQENDMARTARKPKDDDDGGVIAKKDFALAVRLYREDIKPAANKVGEHAQEMSTAYKALKKNAHIQPGAAKLAFKLLETEDAKREDFLRCLNGLLEELGISLKPDLVDQMQAANTGPAPVQANRPTPTLVTIPTSDGTETDLADAAEDLPATAPKKRGRLKAVPAPGTEPRRLPR